MIGHIGLLIEDLGSEAVAHRSEKSSEIHMVAEVAVGFDRMIEIHMVAEVAEGFDRMMYTEAERRNLLETTHTLETHSSTDRQMLDAGTQLDYMAEGQCHNCGLYRCRLASYYPGIRAVSIVAGCRQIVLPDEMVRFGVGSPPDSMRRT